MASTTSAGALAGEASASAHAAAANAEVTVASLVGPDAAREVGTLLDAVWKRPGPVVPADFLQAIGHAGGYLAGARHEGRLVGASVGLLGLGAGVSHLHSHVTGVLPEAHGRGIGRALKLHQRAWCLERGITMVRWTFDPLLRANVAFNLNTLGSSLTDYYIRFYGALDDGYNAGDETDRAVATWSLTNQLAQPARTDEVPCGAAVVLAADPSGAPRFHGDGDGRPRLVELPVDILRWRSTQPERAAQWRLALRAVLVPAMAAGYVGTRLTSAGHLLLVPPS